MKSLYAIRAQMGGFSRCALTGMLVGLLATQTFAQSAPSVSHFDDLSATSATLTTTSEAPDSLPLISTDSTPTDGNALPEAPAAPEPESASLVAPTKADLLADAAATDGSSSTTSTSTTKKHHVRPGFIALGVVGAVAAGFGAYIFSLNTKATGERDALGTLFLAPGAAAAGLGFYFAFK